MQRYPLAWPTGWPRTEAHLRRSPKFTKLVRTSYNDGGTSEHYKDLSVIDAAQRLMDVLKKMGVAEGDGIISTNLKTRLDGLPRGDQPAPQDPGVAVYWQRTDDDSRKVLAIDAYNSVQGNLGAIAATLEAMRAIERHGGARILERAFTGFTALPAPGDTSAGWRQILNVSEGDQRLTTAEAQYLALRSRYHPDRLLTGNPDMFDLVQRAWQQAQAELGNPP